MDAQFTKFTVLLVITLSQLLGTSGFRSLDMGSSFESKLLSLFRLPKRPPSAAHAKRPFIPPFMLELYRKQIYSEVETRNLPTLGSYFSSANTITTFFHSVGDIKDTDKRFSHTSLRVSETMVERDSSSVFPFCRSFGLLASRPARTWVLAVYFGSAIDSKFKNKKKFRLNFDVSSLSKSEAIRGAELRLKVKSDRSSDKYRFIKVKVHEILLPGIKGKTKAIMRLIDSKEVDIHESTETVLDLLPAVERWLHENVNYGVVVEVHDDTGESYRVRLRRNAETESNADWEKVQPVLYVYTDDGRSSPRRKEDLPTRTKRAVKRKSSNICRRHSMYVDFTEIGWTDWIIAPSGFNAYFCAGTCSFPMSDHLNATNHAIIQTIFNSVNPNKAPQPCCIPTALEPISMLYVDTDGKVILKTYSDMVVTACGCR